MQAKLPEGWEWKKWSEVLRIINGKSQKAVEDSNGKYPIYGSGGSIIGYAKEYLSPENSIIIGRKGTINKPIFVKTKFWNVDTAFALVPNEKYLLSGFLFAFCQTFNFERLNTSTTLPSLTKSNLLDIEMPIPPLEVQKSIVSILERAEKIKEKRRQANETTSKLIQSIFYEMFGDPVKNEKKWKSVTVNDIALTKKGSIRMGPFGSQLKKNELVERGIRVLWIENIVNNEFNFKIGKFITEQKYAELTGFTVKAGDVLMTMMGTIGRVAVVPSDIGKSIISSHLLKIEPDQNKINAIFLKNMLLTEHVKSQLLKSAHGIVMNGLNTGIVKETKIFLPPISLQNEFALIVERVEKMKEKQLKATQQAEELFNSLMQKAFKGEILI